MTTVTVQNSYGESRRVKLPPALWEGREEYGTGVKLTGLFYGPRTGRKIARFYSIWDDGSGRCVGTYYREFGEPGSGCHAESDWIDACDTAGIDAPGVRVEEID